ncbi:hypothetical protein [Rubrivivax gelatinosus]|uniref:Tetratricopeptide repeat protein n=1 Tax=Rubrivivax gelatinosus TaxID=28068 RepID=A0A4R2MDF3_RUBGE|nr:hypothetical protein [Rubrivivax gelatinosus]MBK1687142.1 hypothetical protein [Rubrivivax gelatinosus]TCP00656.1 hypothetical protein EV684_11294 [Rubrivivax gelatinosus]
MNLFTGVASDAFFGGPVPASLHGLLRQAAVAGPAQRGALLWTAQAIAPQTLVLYFALVKHHAQRREFELAERAALRGLLEAGHAAGLDGDGQALDGSPPPDFNADGPARFWLFMHKALAFIALRAGDLDTAREHLELIERVAPDARLGDEVVSALLRAAPDE